MGQGVKAPPRFISNSKSHKGPITFPSKKGVNTYARLGHVSKHISIASYGPADLNKDIW